MCVTQGESKVIFIQVIEGGIGLIFLCCINNTVNDSTFISNLENQKIVKEFFTFQYLGITSDRSNSAYEFESSSGISWSDMQMRVRIGGFLVQGISIVLSEILFMGMLTLDYL